VADGQCEALARDAHDIALKPILTALEVRGNKQLVRRERPQRIFDRLKRIAVANLAPCRDSRLRERRQRGLEPSRSRGRAPSSSEAQCLSGVLSAGQTTRTSVGLDAAIALMAARSSAPATVSFATTSSLCSPPGRCGMSVISAACASRWRLNQIATAAVSTTKTPSPTQRSISAPITMSAKYPIVSQTSRNAACSLRMDSSRRLSDSLAELGSSENVNRHVHDDPHHVDKVPVDPAYLEAVMFSPG